MDFSVSKGVFVHKNNVKFTKSKTKSKKNVTSVSNSNIFADQLWYQSYIKEWTNIEKKIQALNDKMFSAVLGNLIAFIQSSYKSNVNEVPAAVLLTGINMPDHVAQFTSLSKEINSSVTPHVVCLQSQNCQNMKSFIENMVHQFVANEHLSEDDDSDSDLAKQVLKKSHCNISALQAWYEDLYSNKKSRKNLVIIIQDFEGFKEEVLQNFILIASSYINILPFVLIFGVATSLSVLHKSLQYQVSSKISLRVFKSQSSSAYLNNILEHVIFKKCPFHLGGKVFTLFTDIFLFYDLSVAGFIKNIKFAMLEHYSYGNAMALCTNFRESQAILSKFSQEDCENARRLLSFRKLVESESYENRIKLLTDDNYLKKVLYDQLVHLHYYVMAFHLFIRCLHVLVQDLPNSPLGKQIREIYNVATSKSIISSQEYKECMQLLNFQAKEEFVKKLEAIKKILEQCLNSSPDFSFTEKYLEEIDALLSNLNDASNQAAIAEKSERDSNINNLNRQQLKEKLLTMSKQTKPQSNYEKTRKAAIDYLSNLFEKHLYEPSRNYFHEIFFFNDASIRNQIVGIHRAAIHTALNDPYYYLQCSCCRIPNDAVIHRSMPDLCVMYKLHLEYGKMINLFDWLQAFLSIVDPINAEDEEDQGRRTIDSQLHARFTQAVAEMEFLGFIKSSKRKTDHVSRLTWGG